jgi:hypothetical protein
LRNLKIIRASKMKPTKLIQSIFKTFVLSALIIAQVHFAYAQTSASILPPAKTTFLDQNGNPLTSGKVYSWIPGTLTPKTTWQDAAETIPNLNPVVLDPAGRALILGSGNYRQQVYDKNNNLQWDQVTSSTGSGGGTGPTSTGDGDLVGTVKPWAGMTAPNQYLFTYGQEISRTTYLALFTAITSLQPVFCTSGSPILTGVGDTTNFWIGMSLEVSCLGAGFSTIISKTATTVTMAANANVTLNTSATFFPWGRGNGTTTFNLPDYRGYVLAGNDIMGGTAAGILTTANFGSQTPDASGAAGGAQTSSTTLITANLPPYTPAGVLTGGVGPPSTAGGVLANTSSGSTGGLGSFGGFSGTPQGGTSTAFITGRIQPTKTTNYIIKVTPDTNSATASGVTSLGGMTGDIACGNGLVCTGNTISSFIPSGAVITTVLHGGSPPAFSAIVGADLPNPSATTLGAIFSAPVSSNSVISGIGNDGTPTFATTTGTSDVVRRTSPTIDTPTITSPSVTGTLTVTGANAKVFAAGRLGATTPAFQVNSLAANQITGIVVTGQSSGNGVNFSAIGETNVPLAIDAAGASGINIGGTSTGPISLFRNTFINHDTNPTLTLGSAGGSLAHLTTPGTSGMAFTTNSSTDQVNIVHTASANRQITLTGSNGGNPTISTTAGNLAITPAVVGAAAIDGTMAATSIKCNTTGGVAISTDCTAAQVRTLTQQGMVLIEVLTASNSATLTTSTFTASFDDYMLVCDNIVPVTDNVNFNTTMESGGTFQSTTYLNTSAMTTAIDLTTASTLSNIAGKGYSSVVTVHNVNSTSVNKYVDGLGKWLSSGGTVIANGIAGGFWNGGQGAVTRMRFQMSSGNISTGSIKVFGYRVAP